MSKVVYYQSKNIKAYPSGNSVDEGKLNLEENLTKIVTRITKRNFVLDKSHFKLSLNGNIVTVSKGQANIVGYCVDTNTSIQVSPPDSSIPVVSNEYTDIYLCMKLALDGSDHVLGDVNGEDGKKYFHGAYLGWFIEDSIDDITLVLGQAKWDGKNITDLQENPDKTQVIDSSNINIFPGLSLMKFVDLLPDIFIMKDGHKVQNGKGGNFYGNLYGMSSRSDNSYGIKIGCNSKDSSSIELKPVSVSELNVEKKVVLDATTNPILKLGLSTLRYVSNVLDISGADVAIQNKTTINKTLHINPEGSSGDHYDFGTDSFEHSFKATDTYKIKTSHNIGSSDKSSEITFQNSSKSIWAGINYNYTNKVLKIYGLSKLSVQMPMEAQSLLLDEVRFRDGSKNSSYIRYDYLKLGNSTGSLVYNINNSDHTLTLNSGGTSTFNLTGSTGTNIVTQNGINITANTGEIRINNVILTAGRNSDELKVHSSYAEFSGDLRASRVYNAVYNDYAEAYEKADLNEVIEPGDIICLDVSTGKYRKVANNDDKKLVIGVCSDTYGCLLGGEDYMTPEEMLQKYIPVGLSGRVYVKTQDDTIKPGDLLASTVYGEAKSVSYDVVSYIGQIIGKALSIPKDGKVLMQIMLQ